MNDDRNVSASPSAPALATEAASGINHDPLGVLTYQATHGSDYRNIYGNIEPADKQQPSKAVANAVQGALHNIRPQDDLEAMLAAQAVTVHHAAMQCFMRAAKGGDSFHARQNELNQGGKLSRTFAMLMDTLDRRRGKGSIEQRIIVQHVYVGDGGKAIVGGSVTSGREGGRQKTEKQPRKKQIEHAAAITMPGSHTQRPVPVAFDAEW